jgi:hypothetical protein
MLPALSIAYGAMPRATIASQKSATVAFTVSVTAATASTKRRTSRLERARARACCSKKEAGAVS